MKITFNHSLIILSAVMLFFGVSCEKKNCKKGITEKVYVANEEDGSVTVFDANTHEILKTVYLEYRGDMYMAHNIQVAPDNNSVWITAAVMDEHRSAGDETHEDMVFVLKGKREKDKEHINIGEDQHPAHIILDDNSEFAYVTAHEKHQLIKIDAKKYEVVDRIDLGDGTYPHGMRYMNGKIYVACMGTNELAIVDAANRSVSKVPMGGIAVQTAVLPVLDAVFTTVYDLKMVVRYDLNTGDTTQIHLPFGSQGPIQLYPSPDNSKVYVCDQGIVNGNPVNNKLYVIETASNTVTNTVTVGNGAHGVVTSIDGSQIFVTNLSDQTVSIIDAATLEVKNTIAVELTPNGISVMKCDCD